MSNASPCDAGDDPHRSVAILVLLMFVTLGLYSFYLVYRWANEVNSLLGREKHHPLVVLLVSILTCGMALIIYECVFGFEVAGMTASRGIAGRMENLPTWLILCNCIASLVSLIPYGVVLGFPLGVLASVLLQAELNKLSQVALAMPAAT